MVNLSRSNFYHLRRLRAVQRSVSKPISRLAPLQSTVHAFICSRIDYCNSLLICLPKVRLSPIHLVLDTAARRMARFPLYSHAYTYMFDELHWLPLHARIKFKILTLIFNCSEIPD